jgi:hypothetical protein
MLRTSRVVATTVTAVLLATGLTAATAGSAQAAGTVSSKYLLNHLSSKGEHAVGYDRSKFTLWADADSDGCDARDEVLIAEATTRPRVGAGCALSGGVWRSPYDGVTTGNPSTFDIDHLVCR